MGLCIEPMGSGRALSLQPHKLAFRLPTGLRPARRMLLWRPPLARPPGNASGPGPDSTLPMDDNETTEGPHPIHITLHEGAHVVSFGASYWAQLHPVQ